MAEDDLPTLELPENFTKEDVKNAVTDEFVKDLQEAHKHARVTAAKTKKVFNGPRH